MGRLCDRLGARLVGATGLVVVAGASAAALGWREAWFAIAMRLVAGFGTAASFVGGSDYVRATVGTPVAQGIFGAVSMAGGGLAVGLLPLWASWRTPFVSAAIVAAAGVVAVLLAPRDGAARSARCEPGHGARSPPVATRGVACRVVRPVGRARQLDGDAAASRRRRLGGDGGDRRGPDPLPRCDLAAAQVVAWSTGRGSCARASSSPRSGTVALLVATPFALAVAGAAVVGLAAGIPFAPSFAGRSARASGCAGCCGRLREHDRRGDDPRRHAAARADVLAAGQRPHRLRRRGGAVSRDRARARYAPSSSVSSAFWTCSRFSASSQIADLLP